MLGVSMRCCCAATVLMGKVVPGGFVPAQDKEYLIALRNCPTARRSIAPRR